MLLVGLASAVSASNEFILLSAVSLLIIQVKKLLQNELKKLKEVLLEPTVSMSKQGVLLIKKENWLTVLLTSLVAASLKMFHGCLRILILALLKSKTQRNLPILPIFQGA